MKVPLFKRILHATDMSDNAVVAAHYALRLCSDYGAYLTIVNVISNVVEEMSANMGYDLASHFDRKSLDRLVKDRIDRSREVLIERINSLCDKAGEQLSDCPACPKISIRAGDPIEQILIEAESDESDLIVVGARGHGFIDEILIGSVARGVVKDSRVPVITIPLAKP